MGSRKNRQELRGFGAGEALLVELRFSATARSAEEVRELQVCCVALDPLGHGLLGIDQFAQGDLGEHIVDDVLKPRP